MIPFLITALTGVVQMFLLNIVLKSTMGGKTARMLLTLLLKLALYGGVATLTVLVFKAELLMAAVGFAVGLPGSALVYFLLQFMNKNNTQKGVDADGHTTDC